MPSDEWLSSFGLPRKLDPSVTCMYKHAQGDYTIALCTSCSRPKKAILIHLSRVMRKHIFCLCENKDADQLRNYNLFHTYIQNFKLLTIFCDCTGLFVSNLVGNPEDRFLTSRPILFWPLIPAWKHCCKVVGQTPSRYGPVMNAGTYCYRIV